MKKSILVLLTFTLLFSCKKYENGPAFSLRSKKSRVVNNWVIQQFTRGGVDSTSTYYAKGSELVLTKDGKADLIQYYHYTKNNYDTTIITTGTGTWEFDSKKDFLGFILTDNADSLHTKNTSVFIITRLKEKEMTVRSQDGTKYVEEFTLVAK